MPLWEGKEFLVALGEGGLVSGAMPAEIGGISIDSRSLQKGDAFFAVQGARDGHEFLAAAAKAGAAALVAKAGKLAEADLAALRAQGAALIAVPNVQAALEALARAARARLKPSARVAAITGSVGKTTAKQMLTCILAQFGAAHCSPASFNNHLGVPLTLATMPRETDYAVLEIGMNHAGEITPLAALARPHLVLITCIAAAHMGHFNNLEEIAAAKAEIFGGLEHNGAALLNRDDAQYGFLRQKLEESKHYVLYGFGRDKAATYRLERETAHGGRQKIAISWNGKKPHEFELNAAGAHMAINACAAVAAAGEMVIAPHFDKLAAQEKHFPGTVADMAAELAPDWENIRRGLAQFAPGAGRGAQEQIPLGKSHFTLIDESYNANPLSMRAALRLLADVKAGGRRMAVLGAMRELGAAEREEHEALAAEILAAKADKIFLVGAEMQSLRARLAQDAPQLPVHWQETAEGLAKMLAAELRGGDALMLKGSNSVGLGSVVKALRGE